MSKAPKISVLMAVYNGEQYLAEAIDSIVNQSFRDFELIIIDDESTDSSLEIIRAYDDPRIVVIRIPHGGLVSALNRGFSEAKGTYIARMDADDRAMKHRFETQVAYLDAHSDIDIVCSDILTIDATGAKSGDQVQLEVNNDVLREGLLNRRAMKPIIHPSIMMRRNVLEELGGYRHFDYAEDHDLWLRAIDRFQFARLNDFLLEYRIYGGGVSRTKGASQAAASAMSSACYLIERETGLDIFNDRPDDFRALRQEMLEKLETRILTPKLAFRNARLQMLNGARAKGLLLLAEVFLRYGRRALPAYSDRMTASLISEMAENYTAKARRTVTG